MPDMNETRTKPFMDIRTALTRITDGEDLDLDEMQAVMGQIMTGEASQAQIGGFLIGLRMKGETVDEITGCANAMKRSAVQVEVDTSTVPLIDVVGTGGDGTHKFNISTIAAFVIAGAGAKVAKHGNRSNRRAGSADVIAANTVSTALSRVRKNRVISSIVTVTGPPAAIRAHTEKPPADSPKIVTRSGSPPKAATLSRVYQFLL